MYCFTYQFKATRASWMYDAYITATSPQKQTLSMLDIYDSISGLLMHGWKNQPEIMQKKECWHAYAVGRPKVKWIPAMQKDTPVTARMILTSSVTCYGNIGCCLFWPQPFTVSMYQQPYGGQVVELCMSLMVGRGLLSHKVCSLTFWHKLLDSWPWCHSSLCIVGTGLWSQAQAWSWVLPSRNCREAYGLGLAKKLYYSPESMVPIHVGTVWYFMNKLITITKIQFFHIWNSGGSALFHLVYTGCNNYL